jgi:hypothetical protein
MDWQAETRDTRTWAGVAWAQAAARSDYSRRSRRHRGHLPAAVLRSLIRSVRPFFRKFEARGPHTISGPGLNFGG